MRISKSRYVGLHEHTLFMLTHFGNNQGMGSFTQKWLAKKPTLAVHSHNLVCRALGAEPVVAGKQALAVHSHSVVYKASFLYYDIARITSILHSIHISCFVMKGKERCIILLTVMDQNNVQWTLYL